MLSDSKMFLSREEQMIPKTSEYASPGGLVDFHAMIFLKM